MLEIFERSCWCEVNDARPEIFSTIVLTFEIKYFIYFLIVGWSQRLTIPSCADNDDHEHYQPEELDITECIEIYSITLSVMNTMWQ